MNAGPRRHPLSLPFLLPAAAVCLLALGIAGCGGDESAGNGSDGGDAGGTMEFDGQIVIGVGGPFSGQLEVIGSAVWNAVELKRDEVNAAGGVNGMEVVLKKGDDNANGNEATQVANSFAATDGLVAVVGHYNSSCSLAAQKVYEENGIPQFSYGSTNKDVARNSPYTWRNIYKDTAQGQAVARYAQQALGLERVAVFFDNDDYGRGLKDAFVEECEAIGLEVVGVESYNRDTVDFRPQLLSFKEQNPDGLFMSGLHSQAQLIAVQAAEKGLDVQLLGADGVFVPEYMEQAGEHAEGTILTCPFLAELGGEKTRAFVAAYEERYGTEPDAWAALAYDALGIVLEAAETGGATRNGIFEHLARMTTPDMGYDGVNGLTYFDEHGDVKDKPIRIAVVRDGRFVPAETQMTDLE